MRAARRVLAGLALIASLALVACGAPAPGDATSAPPSAGPTSSAEPLPAPTGAPSPDPAPVPPTTGAPATAAPPVDPPPSPSAPPTPPPTQQPQPTPVPPAPGPQPGLPTAWRGVDLERVPDGRAVVALTFDAGSSDRGVSAILETLDEQDVPATFFVTGAFARMYPETVREIADAGHAVGNHSDRHLSYESLPDDRIRADLAAAEASITAATGVPAMPLFRFPFGARTEHDIRVVNDAGYLPIRWTVDSLGWKGTSGGLSVDEVVDRVVRTAVPGHIVLMHAGANPDDGSTLDANALPRIIQELRALGYGFVGLGDLVG